ncbi:MAG: FAD:protein FMN transferase [Clostridia bacterium]|nr:FAD:protein FMN transferase [Clostridia bacterium]
MRRRILALIFALVMLTGAALAAGSERTSNVGFYFDTVVTFTLYGAEPGLMDDLMATCARYEALLSKTVTGSDVDRINRAEGQIVTVDPETWEILRSAKEYSALTGGAFSVTIAPVTALWDFTGGTERMPTEDELAAALPLVDDSLLELGDRYTVRLPAGMQVDLGGIAKGYIADQAAALARDRCTAAVLNFGGNVYTVGRKPDGSLFRVGVTDPKQAAGSSICVLSVGDATVVTSGIYERCFEKDGVSYHHILDPQTGYSAMTDLASATIVCGSSMQADAFATACIVLGQEAALDLLSNCGLDGLLIDRDNQIICTEGFAEKYQLQGL